MTNLFQKHYEEDVLELDEIRKAPLSPHELSEAGLNHKDIDDYFILVKELYCELLLFNCQPEMIKVNKVYPNQVKEKFTKLIEFCFLKGLFDRATFEHFKGDKYCCPMDDLSLDAWRFVEYKSAIAIDSLDDFRLKLEDFLAAKSYSWYLDLRYNVIEAIDQEADGVFLYRYSSSEKKLVKLNYHELLSTKELIEKDIDVVASEIEKMLDSIPDDNEESYEYFEQQDSWFQTRISKERLITKLNECLDIVDEGLDAIHESNKSDLTTDQDFECNTDDILYIYRNAIRCHKSNHTIVAATAIFYGRNDSEIQLNVEYCTECKKYFLEYGLYDQYRNKYGILVGNIRMERSGMFSGEYDLALESPLKLSGYSVGQKEDLTVSERRYILARIIHNHIMSKSEVIRYLSYFIKMNGARLGNEIAVKKWKDDLQFVQEYDIEIQPKVYISKVKPF